MADEIIYPVNGKRVWWGAIFAGGIVTLLVSFMLGLLGIAIGAANIDFHNGISASGVGQSALIWWLVITFIAYFCGGCVAGRLANVIRRGDAMLHGIVSWGVVTIAVVVLVGSTVGGVLSGMTNFLAGGLQARGSHQFSAQVQLNEPAGGNATAGTPASSNDLNQNNSQSSQSGSSADQDRQQMRESAGAAAQMTSEAATWTLVALAVGGLAAMFGGASGLGRTRVRTSATTTARA